MAVLILIILWLVYSVVRSLHEEELDKDKKPDKDKQLYFNIQKQITEQSEAEKEI